jgi:hypothetical protein
MNRKEFLTNFGRYGLLALIAGLAVFLIAKRKTTAEEVCELDYACGRCSKRDNCTIERK